MSAYDPTIMTAATMTVEQWLERQASPAPVGLGTHKRWYVANVPSDDAMGIAERLSWLSEHGYEVLWIHAYQTNPWAKEGDRIVPEGAKPVTQIIAVRAKEGGR